ncbi:MAG: sensor histidine kinase, partial [Deltaproteobacteria bacterium]|nr:sensor histidine kinase [Deltaproteobacteria bacterium]
LGQGIQLCARAVRGAPLSESERADLDFLLAEGAQVAHETSDGCARIGVRLRPGDLDAAAVLEIWDNGPPLSDEQRTIFEDPFQATGPERTVALGLALARDIVHQHGGVVTLAETPAGGNVRRVIFPAAAG